ncbi:P-loop containing nucleoside triphosphate hydrolase protein [Sporodiniella umbellata]|nr:P-loop containing nucleoside triphosphate hydrolase protein [Sporodiniella umbellata]
MTTAFLKTALRFKSSQLGEQRLQIVPDANKVFLGDKSFYFDFICPQYATELDTCESIVTPLLDRFVGGNNITLLGYGQTDMYPRSEDQGILYSFAHQLFDKLKNADYQIYASCLELYNENIFDLLADHRDPSAKINPQEEIQWLEIYGKRAYTVKELLSYYKNYHHKTCSHHIFSILIKRSHKKNDTTISKIHFVYLHKVNAKCMYKERLDTILTFFFF